MSGTLLSACALRQAAPGPGAAQVFDHHNHLQSPAVVDAMKRSCRRNPPMCPPVEPKPRTGSEVVRELNEARIGGGLAISTAYIFGLPELGPERLDTAALVRAENEFTVEQARVARGRLVPVISVPVLHPSTVAELNHWLARKHIRAIKLHLTTGGFSFRNQEHVARLAEVFRMVGRAQKGIVLHMRTLERDYGAADVEVFLRDVVPAAAGAPIQIAHLGGWGGFDPKTEAALEAFAASADQGELPPNLFFEISAVAMPGVSPARLQIAVDKIRRLPIQRVLFGTDAGLMMTTHQLLDRTRQSIPLTNAEWTVVLSNRVPFAREPHMLTTR